MFVQPILHFHWPSSLWRRAEIFQYSLSSRKMVALFVNIGEPEKRKSLQQRGVTFSCREIIAIRISWEYKKFLFHFGKSSKYPVNKYNFNCLLSVPRILHTVIAPTSQTQLVLWPWVIFPGTNRKNNYYFINYLNILKIYQRETSYFELSRDMNSDDFSIRINDVTLQWLRCNGFIAMIFVFLFHRCLQTKQPLQAQSLLWPGAVFPDTYRKNTF